MNANKVIDYEAAHAWVMGLINYEAKPYKDRQPWKLDRIRELLNRLGNPQDRIRTIHVAGSKGKGSTSAMIESILRAAGLRTGLYTSPHLHDLRERIQARGDLISEEEFARLVAEVRAAADRTGPLTFFECVTALGFTYFAQSELDVAVVEVGLGGRLDATNLIRKPLAAVITPLSLEHTQLLGDSLSEIAYEKAGIIKPEAPVVVAPQEPEAFEVISREAKEQGASLISVPERWNWRRTRLGLEGQTFDLIGGAGEPLSPPDPSIPADRRDVSYQGLKMPLHGLHQVMNAAVAVAAVSAIQDAAIRPGESAVREGIKTVCWPGRAEILALSPFLMVDGAHNGASAQALASTLRDFTENSLGQWGKVWLVTGISGDKKVEDILAPLIPLAAGVITTQANNLRAVPASVLLEKARAAVGADTGVELFSESSVRDAVRQAQRKAGQGGAVVVTGSLYVVAEAREMFLDQNGFFMGCGKLKPLISFPL
jgi:dihydrofolate synthase/folylpolyglutamate synthase